MLTIRFKNDLSLQIPINVAKSSERIRDVLLEANGHEENEEIPIFLEPRKEIFDLFAERIGMMTSYETCKLVETKDVGNRIDMTYNLPSKLRAFYGKLSELQDLLDFYEIVSMLSIEVIRHEVVLVFYNMLKGKSPEEIKKILNKEGEVNMVKLRIAQQVKRTSYRVFSYVVDKESC